MKITLAQILSFLSVEAIAYTLTSESFKEFEVASLFCKIDKGFYFSTSEEANFFDFKESLIMIQNDKAIETQSGNVYLVVNNAQMIYYKLLAYYFTIVSNGEKSHTCIINNEALIGDNVAIGHFTTIGRATIGTNCKIGANCVINDGVVIGNDTVVEDGSIIGTQGVAWIWDEDTMQKIRQPQLGGVTIGSQCFLGANTIIVRGSLNEHTLIDDGVMLAPGCRIGHGTQIAKFVHLANNVITGGNVQIGKNSFIGSGVVFRPKVRLHDHTIVGAGALVVKNSTAAGLTLMGSPAKEYETKEYPNGMPKPLKI